MATQPLIRMMLLNKIAVVLVMTTQYSCLPLLFLVIFVVVVVLIFVEHDYENVLAVLVFVSIVATKTRQQCLLVVVKIHND